MTRYASVLVALIVLVAAPGVGWAKDRGAPAKKKSYQSYQYQAWSARAKKHPHSPWAEEQGWANQARGKFVFGLKNTLLGWTELFAEPYEAAKGGRNIAGGVGQGLLNGLLDTAGGAAHLVTFPITKFDLPLPEGGTQLF
jgi:hypothetical protein